jgi:hypothetical protein
MNKNLQESYEQKTAGELWTKNLGRIWKVSVVYSKALCSHIPGSIEKNTNLLRKKRRQCTSQFPKLYTQLYLYLLFAHFQRH